MSTLIATVGFPRSGKTTWAKQMKLPIVSPDAIRVALHGLVYQQKAERFVWAIAHTMVEALFLAGHEQVILDACNNTRARRDEWKSEYYHLMFKVIKTDAETCLKRVDTHPMPEQIRSVILRMTKYHEPLGPDEEEFVEF